MYNLHNMTNSSGIIACRKLLYHDKLNIKPRRCQSDPYGVRPGLGQHRQQSARAWLMIR